MAIGDPGHVLHKVRAYFHSPKIKYIVLGEGAAFRVDLHDTVKHRCGQGLGRNVGVWYSSGRASERSPHGHDAVTETNAGSGTRHGACRLDFQQRRFAPA